MSNTATPTESTFHTDAFMAFLDAASARRTKPIKITFRGRQGWSKDIGHYTKAGDGKRIYKRFWLGHDQARAQWLAGTISDYHQQFVENDGASLWTAEHL